MKTKQTVKTLSRWLISMAFALAASLSFGPAYAAEVVTYFHNDIAGTPMVATDASGNVVWKESYLPYGDKLNNSAASSGNKLGFTGKPYDGDTGLSYMGARYYDPLLGRFMGVDSVGFNEANIHSFNRYAYGNNNPYRFVDPDGNSPADILHDAHVLARQAHQIASTQAAESSHSSPLGPSDFKVMDPSGAVAAFFGAKHARDESVTIIAPYARPNGATTTAQRASVQGKSCVDCGATTNRQVADHKEPLVKEYYRTGTIDKDRMRSLDSVQSQCPTCSAKQGADMSRFSREMKKEHGLE